MNNELTSLDIKKMKEELDHRKLVLMPQQIAEVQLTRSYGDLSENFEYKAAKQALNRNKSRMRYLEKMIKTATIIEDKSAEDEIGLYDKVELLFIEEGDIDTVQIVTTVRCNPLEGRISKESPLGLALLGKRVGDHVTVDSDGERYTVEVKNIEKGKDDGTAPLLSY
jgi:transcription elongation factor GreA